MNRSRGTGGSRRGRGNHSSNTSKVPLKGLFSDGIWKCNCDPRLPAQHFQTKNGGKNHGRWFYTCQQSQPKRCEFFLWDDEAKGREATAVLNNSQSEPRSTPVTPVKPKPNPGLPTPQTKEHSRLRSSETGGPYTPSKLGDYTTPSKPGNGTKDDTRATATTTDGSDEEFYDWPASDEDEIEKAIADVSNIMAPPETSRKAIKTDSLSTPGKRQHNDMAAPEAHSYPTPSSAINGNDIFATPATHAKDGKGLFAANKTTYSETSPQPETPTPVRYRPQPPGTPDTELSTDILAALSAHHSTFSLPLEVKEYVRAICNKHVLYTRGIMKGRDVSRAMVKAKEEKMVQMQAEIDGLRSERETNRAVIRHLRREGAKGGGS